MKTLRYIGIVLMAIILTIGFTACSSDDDDEGPVPSPTNTKLWKAKSNGTGKYGYINENGDFVIAAQYDAAYDFYCERAMVQAGGKYYFIDTNGNIINSTGFDSAEKFSNNYARVQKDGVWGLIDKSGNFVIQPTYYALGDVATNGLLAFQLQSGGKWGIINTNNERVINPEYNWVRKFNNGVACVQSGSKYGAINAEGKWVIAPTYDELKSIPGKDLIRFQEKASDNSSSPLYGIMDHNGNIKVQALYKYLYWDENATVVDILRAENISDKYGFIDVNGNTVVPFEYDYASPFYGEYAAVAVNKSANSSERNNYNVIDKSGKILFTLEEKEQLWNVYNGMLKTMKLNENNARVYTYRTKDNKITYTWTE